MPSTDSASAIRRRSRSLHRVWVPAVAPGISDGHGKLRALQLSPAHPPTPTSFPDASDIVVLTHDFPPVIHRGREVTFTATIVGKPGIGKWDKSVFQFYFGYPFPSALKFLSFEGERIGITPSTGETGAWGIMLWGGAFTTGTRLSFTARIEVDLNARLGYVPLFVEADLQNAVKEPRSRFQQFNLMTQIVQ